MKVHYLVLSLYSLPALTMDKPANSQFSSSLQQPLVDYSEKNDRAWGLKPLKQQYVDILYEDDPSYIESNPNGYESVRIPESVMSEEPGCCETCCAPCLGRFLDCLAHICCLK